MSDLVEGDIDLDFLLQFRDDVAFEGGVTHKDSKDQISVRPWHEVLDWDKRCGDL